MSTFEAPRLDAAPKVECEPCQLFCPIEAFQGHEVELEDKRPVSADVNAGQMSGGRFS